MVMEDVGELSSQGIEADGDVKQTGTFIWNYYIDGAHSKRGRAKNITCTFCDTAFTGCSSSRAFAHIIGTAVLGQERSNIEACVPIRKDDDNRSHNSEMLRKFSTKKSLPRNNKLQLRS